MGTMFAMLFATITKLLSSIHGFASAGNHLADWADASAATFAEEAAIIRKAKHTEMLKQYGVTVEQLTEQSK